MSKSKIKVTEPITKENLEKQLSEKSNEKIKELGLILKSDVQGSLEAIINGIEKFKNDEIKIKIVHKGVGENKPIGCRACNSIRKFCYSCWF